MAMSNRKIAFLSAFICAGILMLGIVAIVLTMAFSGPAVSADGAQNDIVPVEEAAAPACDFNQWIGLSAEDAEREVKKTGRQYRIVRPNQPVTMDYRPDRINLELDEDDIVIGVHCV